MKKTIIFIIVFLICNTVMVQSITRDELYQKFGPILIEAIVLVIKDEINILRTQAGFEPRTNEQIKNAVDQKLQGLSKYNWMDNE